MPVGGPVASFASGLLGGFVQSQNRAHDRMRQQLADSLRLVKEKREFENRMRESQDAIAKENLAYQKSRAEAENAQHNYDLVQARIAQIMASPGAPFKDAALEGHLEEARERLTDAHEEMLDRQARLQDLIADRDARIRGNIQTKAGGFLGFGQSVVPPEQRTPEQREAYKAEIQQAETANTPENKEFAKSARETQRDIAKSRETESRERAKVGGYTKAIDAGRAAQGPINEEKRQAQLFPLEKEARELQTKKQEWLDAAAAAMQERDARQRQMQQDQQAQQALEAQPGYQRAMQGGAATGKGGGGLIGAITGKGGGMGSQGMRVAGSALQGLSGGMAQPPAGMGAPGVSQGVPGAMQGGGSTFPGMGAPGSGPTVGQALAPIAGKFLQMPAPQAISMVRSVLGGAPPAGFAGKGSLGASGLGQRSSLTQRPTGPAQGGGLREGARTTHFHFHQAPSGSRGNGAPGQEQRQYAAPMPPRRPDFQAQSGPGQPDWWSSHPVVPASVAGKYAQPQAPQITRKIRLPSQTPPSEAVQSLQTAEPPQSLRASNLNQGVPTIDHPDKLKGMKPGSIFRAPDGRLKMIPTDAPGASSP